MTIGKKIHFFSEVRRGGVMDETYNYSLFLRIKGSRASAELPPAPVSIGLKIQQEQLREEVSSWNLRLPLGLSRDQLVDLLEWFEKLEDSLGDYELYDPQAGRPLALPDDDEVLVEGVLRHDQWILDNVGGDSMGSPPEESPLLPPRTKLILWLALGLVLLYFITRFMLSSYFRS